MTVYWPDNELKEPDDVPEGWDEMMPTENINFNGCDDRCMSSALYEIQYFLLTHDIHYTFYDARIRRAFHAVKEARRMKYVTRNLVEDWVDETGKIVLIGDAAHPVIVSRTKSI